MLVASLPVSSLSFTSLGNTEVGDSDLIGMFNNRQSDLKVIAASSRSAEPIQDGEAEGGKV